MCRVEEKVVTSTLAERTRCTTALISFLLALGRGESPSFLHGGGSPEAPADGGSGGRSDERQRMGLTTFRRAGKNVHDSARINLHFWAGLSCLHASIKMFCGKLFFV